MNARAGLSILAVGLALTCSRQSPTHDDSSGEVRIAPMLRLEKGLAASDVDSIYVIVTGDGIDGERRFAMTVDKQNNRFYGEISVPEGGSEWVITVVLLDGSGKKVGQGYVRITDPYADVVVPVVSSTSAFPHVDLLYASETTADPGDTVELHGLASDNFGGTIVKYEWDIGNTGTFVEAASPETTIVMPSMSQLYECVLRVTDDDGNTAMDTVGIAVVGDAPVLVWPRDGDTLASTNVVLQWIAGTYDSSFTVYLDTVNGAQSKAGTGIGDTFVDVSSQIENGKTFYWRVIGYGNDGESGASETWSFTVRKPATVVSEGLVAYYPFNGNANDASGNGNDGVVYGATLTADRFGDANRAYDFDGISSIIVVPGANNALLEPSEAMTISCFIKARTSLFGPIRRIVRKCADRSPGYLLSWCRGNRTLEGCFYVDFYNFECVGVPNQSYTERWTHVAVTCSRAEQSARLYIDGGLAAEDSAFSYDFTHSDSNLTIGGFLKDTTHKEIFDGLIDDVRIYDYALSSNEVDSLYHLGGWPSSSASGNSPPQFTSTMTTSAVVGVLYRDTLRATDPDGDAITFSPIYHASPDMTLNDSIFIWTPTSTDVGPNMVTVQASDGNGGYDTLAWSITVQSAGQAEGVVAYYPFSGNVNDSSGNNYHGTMHYSSLTSVADRFGNANSAYFFDGIDHYIEISGVPILQNISISFWVRADSTGPVFGAEGSYAVQIQDTHVETRLNSGSACSDSLGAGPGANFPYVGDGQWHHVVWTYSVWGGGPVYVDGMSDPVVVTEPLPSGIPQCGWGTFLGTDRDPQTQFPPSFFKGAIDDVRIYDRALDDGDVDSLYHEFGWGSTYLFADEFDNGTWEDVWELHSVEGDSLATTVTEFSDSLHVQVQKPVTNCNVVVLQSQSIVSAGDFTIEVRVKKSGYGGTKFGIIDSEIDIDTCSDVLHLDNDLLFGWDTDDVPYLLSEIMENGAFDYTAIEPYALLFDMWATLKLVKTGSSVELYADDVLKATRTTSIFDGKSLRLLMLFWPCQWKSGDTNDKVDYIRVYR